MLRSVDTILGMTPIEFMAKILVLFTALPIHEYAHAAIATKLGDNTADLQGRLTLNPFSHLSPIGSVALILLGFGWANPVPIDPRNFKNYKRGMALTALAGPVANIMMAFIALVITKIIIGFAPSFGLYSPIHIVLLMFHYMTQINLWLAVFNLLPIPPLDGSKIFGILLPSKLYYGLLRHEQIFSLALVALLYTGLIYPPLYWLSDTIETGLNYIAYPIDILIAFIKG